MVAFGAFAPRVATASPTPTDAEQADKLFAEGRALITANKPAEACEKFEAAIKLDPTAAGTMLNLGVCYEQLNKPEVGARLVPQDASAREQTNLPDYEAAYEEHTRTLAGVVPTVSVSSRRRRPMAPKVRIDGIDIPSTDFQRVEVDPLPSRARRARQDERRITKNSISTCARASRSRSRW